MNSLVLSAAGPILVATKNPHKLRELLALWGTAPPPLAAAKLVPDVDERFDTYEENAILKARSLAEQINGPALGEDSGIEVEALGWGPGVRSARTPFPNSTPAERNENILSELRGRVGAERQARYVCACALLVPGLDPIVARGECEGRIADGPRGSAGFGYDPIFMYPPFEMTFAEAGQEKKNAVSHRSKAIRALREKLRSAIR